MKILLKPVLVYVWISITMLNSCSLDTAPEGYVSLDDIFSDTEKTAAYLNTCYAYIPVMGMRYFFWSRGPVEWSDEAWDTDAETEPSLMSGRMYRGDATANNHPIVNISADAGNGDYWNRYWDAIHKCSVFLSRVAGSPASQSDKNRWKAEAHLLRAFYYSELLRWFGTGMPVEREPFPLQDNYPDVRISSYYEVVQFIMEECDAALNTSELPWRITTDAENGRLTKALAEAIKSRMILYAASPLYNQGEKLWEEAYTVNKTSLSNLRANGYGLYNQVNLPGIYRDENAFLPSDYSALYNEYFTQPMAYSASPVDKETIYQNKEGQGQVWFLDGIGMQAGTKSGTCPSQELVDAYETEDGEPILDLANPYLDGETHLNPNYNPANKLYDPKNPYENRDPRFYASIYYNGSKRKCWWGFNETPDSPENYPASIGNRIRIVTTYIGENQTGIDATRRNGTRTGYYERKFLHPFSGTDNDIHGANFKMFRLGETVLNFAEAAAEAGHLDEAIAAVNEIRNRAGMPDLPAGLSKEQLILRIRNERRVELAMEGFRYFDIRRWSNPSGDLAKTDKWITAAKITRNADGSYTYNRGPVSVQRQCYTNKYLWIPIPMRDAVQMEEQTGQKWQNPGW